MKLQEPVLDPLLQIETDGFHIVYRLCSGFLESEIEAPLAATAGGVDKGEREARFPRTGCAAEKDAAFPEKAPVIQHCIEIGNYGGDMLPGRFVLKPNGCYGDQSDPPLIDDERERRDARPLCT